MRTRFSARFFLPALRKWACRTLVGSLVFVFFASQTTVASARLVIFTTDQDLEALLTSTLKGQEILSRSGLPQAAAEAALSGASLDLKGATLALILEKSGLETSVRLVSAPSGATVAHWMAPPLPLDELARWIARRAEPFLSATAKSGAPRVSLLGLRFETDSAPHRTAERLANLMLAAEFQAAGTVVLERWRMGDLVFEKSLRAEESEFWQQADVLDGSLRQENGRFIAEIRIRGHASPERRLTVHAETLPLLAKKVASLALERPSADERFRGLESEAFLAEARWMLNNGLPREAWQATEAALALGGSGFALEALRIRAAAMTAYPDDLRTQYAGDGGYRADAIPVDALADHVAAATEAVHLAGDYLAEAGSWGPPNWWSLEHPVTLGVQTFYTGLRVLRRACDSGWERENSAATQGLLRALRREVSLLEKAPLGGQRCTFVTYRACYMAYLSANPAEAVAFYRDVLRPDFDGGARRWPLIIRSALAGQDRPRPPFLAGDAPQKDFPFGAGAPFVRDGEGQSAPEAWEKFLDELAASPDALSQADSLALRWQSTADLSARLTLTARIVDFLDAHPALVYGPHGRAVFEELLEPLRDVNQSKELAPAQKKLAALFHRLVEAPDPLPREVLPLVWSAFTERKLNATEAQAGRLASAIDRRASRPGISREEFSQLRAARAALEQEYPALHRAETAAHPATATTFWLAREQAPEALRENLGFHDEAVLWHQGSLWALDPFGGRLWQIQPATGETKVISPDNLPKVGFGSQLQAWGERFAVTTDAGVSVLNKDRSTWQPLNLPPARYCIGVSGDTLWAASGERPQVGVPDSATGAALYRISPDLTVTLFASSRRRPSLHPLDKALTGQPFTILPAAGSGVILGIQGHPWTFLDSASGEPPAALNPFFAGNVRLSSHPDIVVRCVRSEGDGNRLNRVEAFTPQGHEVLLSRPGKNADIKARFPYPAELDGLAARDYAVAWDGRTLTILAWSSTGSPWGANEARLFWIRAEGCATAPLQFAWPEGGEERARRARHDVKSIRYPLPKAKSLIPTDDGLAVTGSGLQGFWFIPNTQLPQEFR